MILPIHNGTVGEVIKFYRTTDEHGMLSNFAKYPIFLKSRMWPTSEHYFQAQKFLGTEFEEVVRAAPTPFAAASLGRSAEAPIHADWDSRKDNIMRSAVFAKFTQHDELKRTLLGTGTALIVEHTANDAYWGDGGDGTGVNMLGRILMEVRELIGRVEFLGA